MRAQETLATPAGEAGSPPPHVGTAVLSLRVVTTILNRDLIRLRRQPVRVAGLIAGPALILLSLGVGLGTALQARTDFDYASFLFPGVVAMAVILPAIGSAASIVVDREAGFLRELLVAPVSRVALVGGKVASGTVIATLQGGLLACLAPIVGVAFTPGAALRLLGGMVVLAFAMSAFGVLVASRTGRIESYQMLLNLVVNPMFFLSGATFPLAGLPPWLAAVTTLNPVTYAVDAMRRSLPASAAAVPPARIGELAVPIAVELLMVLALGVALAAAAARSFRRMS